MRIGIVTPAPPRSKYGNRVTALRWAGILRSLGHRVKVALTYEREGYDLLIALHARRSYPSVWRFHQDHSNRPLIVALTGTDLYHDLPRSRAAQKSLALATRIVALQPKARGELNPGLCAKLRIIYQSAPKNSWNTARRRRFNSGRTFDVSVVGHLRPVKDPFRAALAARQLPPGSRVRILHVGAAMNREMAMKARAEMRLNPRYLWLGERPRWQVARILARSAVCVLSSKMEGGANLISEAAMAGVPLLASRIPGSVGLLGENYPGYFTPGSTSELARLLHRTEVDPTFLAKLRSRVEMLAGGFEPAREKEAWRLLLAELE